MPFNEQDERTGVFVDAVPVRRTEAPILIVESPELGVRYRTATHGELSAIYSRLKGSRDNQAVLAYLRQEFGDVQGGGKAHHTGGAGRLLAN